MSMYRRDNDRSRRCGSVSIRAAAEAAAHVGASSGRRTYVDYGPNPLTVPAAIVQIRCIIESTAIEEPAVDTPLNLRETGRLRVLETLHELGRTSRAELVRRTGLSRATVSAIVADMIAGGLVREHSGAPVEDQHGAHPAAGAEVGGGTGFGETTEAESRPAGRPVQPLSIDASAGYAVGADIGHTHVRVVRCDLAGRPEWETMVAKDVDRAPRETLDLAADLIEKAVSGVPRDRVLGIGIGIAAPVDTRSGALGTDGIMSGWGGIRPGDELTARTGLTTRLTNDANAGALAERLYGAGRTVRDMV